MRKTVFLILLLLCTFCMAATVALAADKTYSVNSKLQSNTVLDNCVIEEGVTLNLNGRGLEIGKSLKVKKNGRLTGGMIIFGRNSTCEGMTLYYMLDGKYRKLPVSIKEVAAMSDSDLRPQFVYVKEIDAYCLSGDGHKPTNGTGNPFNEDLNKEKADKILADLGKISVSASLTDIDRVKLSWKEQENGKNYMISFKIYYRNITANDQYEELAVVDDLHKTTFVTDSLSPCTKYKFKLVPVIEYFNNTYEGKASYCDIYTLGIPKLKSVSAVADDSSRVKVSWTNLKGTGESGYEIRISGDEDGTDIIKTVKVNSKSAKSKKIKVKKGEYYYSIRTYKTVNGEKKYSEWSDCLKYEI